MTFMPRFVVPDNEAPQPLGPRYGLLTAAAGPVLMPSKAQGGGISYYPTSCGFTRDHPVVCAPDDSPGESPGDSETKIFDPGTPFTEGDPFALYSTIQCGSAGLGALSPDAVATIERRLQLRFSNGLAAGVEDAASLAFAGSGAVQLAPPDSGDIVSVVAALEQWLYGRRPVGGQLGQGYGMRGYLHVTPTTFEYMQSQRLIDRDVNQRQLWVTAMGTVVAPGAYSGALPGDAAAVDGTDALYITGQFTVWESSDTIQPSLRETFDREANQWMALLERIYIVTWDCAIAAAPFDYGTGSP